MVLEIQVV